MNKFLILAAFLGMLVETSLWFTHIDLISTLLLVAGWAVWVWIARDHYHV